jgi:hypothetical protein
MASIQLSRHEAEEGDLPDVCMCCGAPATERKRRRFISHPLWVYLLLPFGYLPYVIVAAILTENVRCYTLFCARHKNHWLLRTLIIWGAFIVLLAFLAGSFALVGSMSGPASKSTQDTLFGLLCIAMPVLLLCWLISIPIMQLTAIHPANVTEHRLTLKCVSPAFVEAVRNYREDHKSEELPEDYRRKFRPRPSPSDHGYLEPGRIGQHDRGDGPRPSPSDHGYLEQ